MVKIQSTLSDAETRLWGRLDRLDRRGGEPTEQSLLDRLAIWGELIEEFGVEITPAGWGDICVDVSLLGTPYPASLAASVVDGFETRHNAIVDGWEAGPDDVEAARLRAEATRLHRRFRRAKYALRAAKRAGFFVSSEAEEKVRQARDIIDSERFVYKHCL